MAKHSPQELLEFIKSGNTVKEIATFTGLSECSISSKLRSVNYRQFYSKKNGPSSRFSDEYIIELFNSGKKIVEIAEITQTDQTSIGRRLRKYGINTKCNSGQREYSKEFISKIVQEYLNGKKSHIIKKEYKLSEKMVIEWVRKSGHEVVTNPQTIHIMNEKFFHTSTPESAYFMGLLLTDGGFRNGSISLYLNKKDDYIVRRFQQLLGSFHKFRYNKDGTCGFTFRNAVIDQFLTENLDLPRSRKTYNMGFPEKVFNFYSDNLTHLIRGIIDGDGTIMYSDKTFHRILICSYSKEFCIGLSDAICLLINRKCGYISSAKNRVIHNSVFSGGRICRSIIQEIYSNSEGIRLERKYEKAMQIVNHKKV